MHPYADPLSPIAVATVVGNGDLDLTADARFEQAYLHHRDALLGWLRARTRDEAAAEDICQEAYSRLLCQLRAGSAPDNVAAWLHRVALNLVISGARHAKVVQARTPHAREADGADPTAEQVLARERFRDLAQGLGRVPANQRPILVMAATGMTTAQIASRLGTQGGAARTRLHRARRALRDQLAVA